MLEILGFDEFVCIHSSNIEMLHKNKCASGVDKYNYFKKFKDLDIL